MLKYAAPEICQTNAGLGKCVDNFLCSTMNASYTQCHNGKVCCIVSMKIVTPTNAQPGPPASGEF